MMGGLWLDIEVLADREEELQLLLAMRDEDEADDDLPPIIQDEVPEWDTWGEAA